MEKKTRKNSRLNITPDKLPPLEDRRKITFHPDLEIKHEFWASNVGVVYEIGWNSNKILKYWIRRPIEYGRHREDVDNFEVLSFPKKKTIATHILVWCAWNNVIYDGAYVRVEHINGNKKDNTPENLRVRLRNSKIITFKGSNGGIKRISDLTPKYKTEEEYAKEYSKIVDDAGSEKNLLKKVPEVWKTPSAIEDQFIPEIEEKIIQYIRAGAFVETAIMAAGINRKVFEAWQEDARLNPEGRFAVFKSKVDQAVSQSEVLLAGKVNTAAGRHWQAATWLLERKYPQRWKNNNVARQEGDVQSQTEIDASKSVDLKKLSVEELKVLEDIYSKQGKELDQND